MVCPEPVHEAGVAMEHEGAAVVEDGGDGEAGDELEIAGCRRAAGEAQDLTEPCDGQLDRFADDLVPDRAVGDGSAGRKPRRGGRGRGARSPPHPSDAVGIVAERAEDRRPLLWSADAESDGKNGGMVV